MFFRKTDKIRTVGAQYFAVHVISVGKSVRKSSEHKKQQDEYGYGN